MADERHTLVVVNPGHFHAALTLRLPHPRFRARPFVLGPLAALAPRWKDPESGVTMARLWRTRGLPGRG